MLNLPGYQILEQIYDSHKSRVYKGYREQDNQPAIIKLLNQDYPTPKDLSRYQQEFEILSSLKNIDTVVKAYALESYQNTLVTILEDFGGTSLSNFLLENIFKIRNFLPLAIQIVDAIEQIHLNHIIHKDINPSNIVWNNQTEQIKIIDFGISSRFTPEETESEPKNTLEGTIIYMSPEQTGRMNRTVDYRTDFYSLGVTFYEMLTGKLPFHVTDLTDPIELVHCHIAKQPIPPQKVNPEIPKAVSDIILKLLAKNAEDRYQSAWGIRVDLENCLNQLEHHGAITSFPLGTQDICERFQIPQKLYGRDPEIQTLLGAFDQAIEGDKQFVLISGKPGIGKSSLVQEIYQPITQRQGYLLTGQFDPSQEQLPYDAIVQAFSGLIQQLLTESEAKLNHWQTKLIDALGTQAQIIIDVIPDLKLILGEDSLVEQLESEQNQAASDAEFEQVFLNFIHVFCDREHPIVIFLDDFHWADWATLDLITAIGLDQAIDHLFLIVAYRDPALLENPEMPIQDFMSSSLKLLQQANLTIHQITLNPLTYDSINALISETLQQDSESVKILAGIVVCKTEGIPGLVHKFLTKIYQNKLLHFDSSFEIKDLNYHRWTWDIKEIKTVEITNLDSDVDISVDELKQFPEATQKILTLAACLGKYFDLQTISIISEKSIQEIFYILWPFIEKDVILPTKNRIEINDNCQPDILIFNNLYFSSNQFQQAAHNLIYAQDKIFIKHLQLKIGFLLTGQDFTVDSRQQIFKLLQNLNSAQYLIVDQLDQVELSDLNFKVGEIAKAQKSYQLAKEYFIYGISFLNHKTCWEQNYDLTFALYNNLAEVELKTNDFKSAEDRLYFLMERLQSTIKKAEIAHKLILHYGRIAKNKQAIVLGRKALKWLGVNLPISDLEIAENFQQEIQRVTKYLEHRKIETLINQKSPMNVAKTMSIKLLTSLSLAAQKVDRELFNLLIVKAVNLTLQYGQIPESAYAYAAYGVILISVVGDELASYQLGKLAYNLSKKIDDPVQKCLIYNLYANAIIPWFKPISFANSMNTQGYQIALEAGELGLAQNLLANRCVNYFYQGKFLAHLMTDLNKCINLTKVGDRSWTTDAILAIQIAISNLTGQTANYLTFANENYQEYQLLESAQDRNNLSVICFYKICKLQVLYLYEEYSQAISLALDIENLLDYVRGSLANFEYIFYYSLSLISQHQKLPLSEETALLIKLAKNQKKLKKWVKQCPENFKAKFFLVEAEIARINGETVKAMNLYDYVIQLVQGHEYIQIRALADELAAKFWLENNKEEFAKLYLEKARACYQMWGAKRKVEKLELKYASLLPMNPEEKAKVIDQIQPSSTLSSPLMSTLSRTTSYLSSNSEASILDLGTVMKSSQAISSEIFLDKLLEKLMTILLENAGAQKGFLILENNGKLLIEAEGRMVSDIVPESSSSQTMIKVLQSISIAELDPKTAPLPTAIVNYVARTKEPVLPDATQLGNDSYTSAKNVDTNAHNRQFSNDPYVQKNQPKSILCAPLMSQGNLSGIVYMENNLTTGAFTPARLEMLNLLSSQAAISIQNSRYYSDMAALNQAYERFVPRQFLQFLNKTSILDVQLGDNVEQEMSVLFSDIRGFTTLSESLTPEENFKFINSYLSSMEPAIVENNGFIDKYIGDAIMALFPGGADDSVEAAISMLKRLSEYNQGRKRAGYIPISIGIGINTGDLMLGTVGGHSRMDTTVISDAVNLASRLEGLTKAYGVSLLISHQTFLHLSNATNYNIRIIERLKVKGKSHPVAVFEVFDGDEPELFEPKLATASLFEEALMLYYRKAYQEAEKLFEDCLRQNNRDRAIQVYLERCRAHL